VCVTVCVCVCVCVCVSVCERRSVCAGSACIFICVYISVCVREFSISFLSASADACQDLIILGEQPPMCASVKPNTWTHVAVVWDRKRAMCSSYINGELAEEGRCVLRLCAGMHACMHVCVCVCVCVCACACAYMCLYMCVLAHDCCTHREQENGCSTMHGARPRGWVTSLDLQDNAHSGYRVGSKQDSEGESASCFNGAIALVQMVPRAVSPELIAAHARSRLGARGSK
jgi:hypothetical protein